MTAQLADRVRKARRQTWCVICKRPILVGQLIARTGTWVHARCATRRHEAGRRE